MYVNWHTRVCDVSGMWTLLFVDENEAVLYYSYSKGDFGSHISYAYVVNKMTMHTSGTYKEGEEPKGRGFFTVVLND